jgi:hypothetical protein
MPCFRYLFCPFSLPTTARLRELFSPTPSSPPVVSLLLRFRFASSPPLSNTRYSMPTRCLVLTHRCSQTCRCTGTERSPPTTFFQKPRSARRYLPRQPISFCSLILCPNPRGPRIHCWTLRSCGAGVASGTVALRLMICSRCRHLQVLCRCPFHRSKSSPAVALNPFSVIGCACVCVDSTLLLGVCAFLDRLEAAVIRYIVGLSLLLLMRLLIACGLFFSSRSSLSSSASSFGTCSLSLIAPLLVVSDSTADVPLSGLEQCEL